MWEELTFMKEQFYGHKSDNVNKESTPVVKHLNYDAYQNINTRI